MKGEELIAEVAGAIPGGPVKKNKCCQKMPDVLVTSESEAWLVVTNRRTLIVKGANMASSTRKKCCKNSKFLGAAFGKQVEYIIGKYTSLSFDTSSSFTPFKGLCCCCNGLKSNRSTKITFSTDAEHMSYVFNADVSAEEAQVVVDAMYFNWPSNVKGGFWKGFLLSIIKRPAHLFEETEVLTLVGAVTNDIA